MLAIDRAIFPDDAEPLEVLFRGYVEFLFARQPQDRVAIAQKYDPARVSELVRQFFRVHARPTGELLIARLDGRPVGCAMMRQTEPGIVEVQRVFVTGEARGHGVGKALTLALIDRARADGQRLMRLDTGRTLDEAIGLYTRLGFRERSPYHADTPQLDHLLRYFELAL